MLVIDLETKAWISCSLNSNGVTLQIFGTDKEIHNLLDICSSRFKIAEAYIEWIYSTDGQSVNVPLRQDRKPITEMYPFLQGEEIESFYDRFMDSDASILVLIGPPGTGKTTFIRGLLQHTKSSAIVTYDAAILEKDYVFAQFIEGDTNIMVMEDADTFLRARSDGNTMMHRFLNVGDGLVTTKGKKMIFSTNLPSIRDVDPALIRPGRCFDVVNFDNLTPADAEVLAKKVGSTLEDGKSKYTIAEIFNGSLEPERFIRKVGFV
jgi:energy-coupling factor transporter ATP-binding protein EcfA2